MSEFREPLLVVAVGKKGVGKTWETNEQFRDYMIGNPSKGVKGRKVLILDVNDEFTHVKALSLRDVLKFSAHPKIEARRIRPFREDTGRKMTMRDIQECLFHILQNYSGGLLLIEDINKYISDMLPNDVIGAICTNRHNDLDIIMHFQSIGRVTSKIWQNLNMIRFHKNTDSVDKHRHKFEDKYEYLKIAELIVNKKYSNGDRRFFLWVDIDNEKLRGAFTKEDVEVAIEEYISRNYRTIINPMLQQITKTGEKKYTAETAYQAVRERILRDFIV